MASSPTARLLEALERAVTALGWDQPAGLYAIVEHPPEPGGRSLTLAAEPVAALVGNPLCALLRLRPELTAAQGAAVVTEAWAYGPEAYALLERGKLPGFSPAADPERIELRVAQLVMADGTTDVVEHRRGSAPTHRELEGPSWLRAVLRRSLGLASQAPAPQPDLALRLVLVWQVSQVLLLADGGYDLAGFHSGDGEWGRFVIPSLGELPAGVRDPWWAPVEQAVTGAALDVTALAAAVREQLAEQPDVSRCLPVAFALERGEDEMLASPELVEWMDDEMLVAFVDLTVPDTEVLSHSATHSLPPALRDGFLRRLRG